MIIASVFLGFMACNDLIDKNLANGYLKINNPADSFITSNYNVNFLWEKVAGAGSYHIQIVQPNFDNIQILVLDTQVLGDRLIYPLFPGQYQWRIRSENGSTHSAFITRYIRVDTNSNLNNQTFIVLTPGNSYISNNSVVDFTWVAFPYATYYEFILLDSSGNILHTKRSYQMFLLDTISEGRYTWHAHAVNTNNGTSTQFSPINNLVIDLTPPVVASPQSPVNNSVDTNIVTLSWTHSDEIYGDSVFVSNDSTFRTAVINKFLINTSSCILPSLPINQSYFWRIRSRDIAGNWSNYSVVFKFVIH
jgi:hypothetical protein